MIAAIAGGNRCPRNDLSSGGGREINTQDLPKISPVECAAPKDMGHKHPAPREWRQQAGVSAGRGGVAAAACYSTTRKTSGGYGVTVAFAAAGSRQHATTRTLHVIVGTEKRKNRLLESAAVLKQFFVVS